MPKGPTLYLVLALVAVAITAGLLIGGGLGGPSLPDLAFTPVATAQAAAASPTLVPATEVPNTEPTLAASATSAPSATAAPTATPAPSATREPSATPATTATVEVTAAPSPEGGGAFVEYTVAKGDTLNAIALRYNTTTAAILAVNDIPDPGALTVGTLLRIPADAASVFVEHTVVRGETLVGIARQYGVSQEAILLVNAIPNPRSLTVGAVLRIPRR